MNVDRNLVLHIANLARIELTAEEVELFQSQLSTIVQYIDQLNEVQEMARPYSFDAGNQNRVRRDEPAESLPVDDALKNAPDRRDNLFRVPRILP
jgi:aspartyl-tRNA(Asn)/glutamyl-tRNA(Gln) amidotransferase subunit C